MDAIKKLLSSHYIPDNMLAIKVLYDKYGPKYILDNFNSKNQLIWRTGNPPYTVVFNIGEIYIFRGFSWYQSSLNPDIYGKKEIIKI